MQPCSFCTMNPEKIILENELCLAFFDNHPVSRGHLLLIPKAHKENYFALSLEEKAALDSLIMQAKDYLDSHYAPDGYNIGFNSGESAGQTIAHCHCHLIPRYEGDTLFPRGGVRGVIPGKMDY